VLTTVVNNEPPSANIVEEKENVTRIHQETAPKPDIVLSEVPT